MVLKLLFYEVADWTDTNYAGNSDLVQLGLRIRTLKLLRVYLLCTVMYCKPMPHNN
jgi:hypothetical protein